MSYETLKTKTAKTQDGSKESVHYLRYTDSELDLICRAVTGQGYQDAKDAGAVKIMDTIRENLLEASKILAARKQTIQDAIPEEVAEEE